jgi:Dolichyl-phosphate-mannose-protein mannosyltransferase
MSMRNWLLRRPSSGAYALVALALLTGVALRFLRFFASRSLSQDESQLAVNIITRSFRGLFSELDFNQAAPQGFLAGQKLVVDIFGTNDYTLRLLPLAAGCLALFVMVLLAREVLRGAFVALAVALFAFLDPLIYYAATDKQYSVDAFLATTILWLGFRSISRPDDKWPLVLFTAIAATAIWFSHPSVFVSAGVSLALVGAAMLRREWHWALATASGSAVWLVSFGVFVLVGLPNVSGVQQSLDNLPGAYGSAGFGSGGLTETGALRTTVGAFRYVAGIPQIVPLGDYDGGIVIGFFAAALCLVGLRSMSKRSAEKATALTAPLVMMLIAWGIGRYPLIGRTQLFLAPAYVLFLTEGISSLGSRKRSVKVRTTLAVIGAVVIASVFALGIKQAVDPPNFNEIKPVLNYVARAQRPGDTVYVYFTAQPQLRYYLECHCAGSAFERAQRRGLWPLRRSSGGTAQFASRLRSVPPRLIVADYRGQAPSLYVGDFDALRGRRRVWILLPEVDGRTRTFLLEQLNRRGRQRAAFSVSHGGDDPNGVSVYLYDMTS